MASARTSTKGAPTTALVIHGHFYQPPRENPWTDEVGREASAAPFENWNARIHAECYRANAYARIYGDAHKPTALVNNYERMSFDLGPTLARWIERHDPHVIRRMREGDAEQKARLGGGGAMAHVWGHPIAPLLNARDLRTQILWGLFDFRARLGREPLGMWLPETAADSRTLAALIDAGLQFTVLAPEQIEAVRASASLDFQEVTKDTLDTGQLYRFMHPDGSGRSLALAIFDGPLSRDLAFGHVSRDAASYLAAVEASAARSRVSSRRLVIAASDGELYGHHKKFADLTLAYLTRIAAAAKGLEVTNLEAYVATNPPTWEARLRPGPQGEGTAWSCGHGLGRWQRDCGCRMTDIPGNRQTWRGPLRLALDLLRDRAADFFTEAGGRLFADPWEARDTYGAVVDAPVAKRAAHLKALGTKGLKNGSPSAVKSALRHMEMQRSLLLMYASCAWFFDDIAGPEAALALRRAGHAIECWRALGGAPPETEVLDALAQAHSNTASLGTGADAYRRAMEKRVTHTQVVAASVFNQMANAPAYYASSSTCGYSVTLENHRPQNAHKIVRGIAKVRDERLGETSNYVYRARYDGLANFTCTVGKERFSLPDLKDDLGRALRFGVLMRLSNTARMASDCQTILAMADSMTDASPDEEVALVNLCVRLLARFLREDQPPTAAHYQLALRLAERAKLPLPTDDGHRVEEAIWEDLERFRIEKKRIPAALTQLAIKLGFAVSPEEKGSVEK